MKLFRRRSQTPTASHPQSTTTADQPVAATDESSVPGGDVPSDEPSAHGEIEVSRTLVKSEPELAELVAAEPRLAAAGIAVSLSEKGFGTRVAITAEPSAGLGHDDLESLLDGFAEPQKRPFTNN